MPKTEAQRRRIIAMMEAILEKGRREYGIVIEPTPPAGPPVSGTDEHPERT